METYTIHKDKTVTYWSVHDQTWKRRIEPLNIPDRELAAMTKQKRERILRTVEKQKVN